MGRSESARTGLRVHRAERADVLAEGLADLLAVPSRDADPFVSELVIVPAKGVERWLSQRLSHRLGVRRADDGVCAGVEFRSPRSLVAEVLGVGGDGVDADDSWAPDTLAWTLLGVIDASLSANPPDPRLHPLAQHLGRDHTGEEAELRRGRRWSVARRLAGLFTSYAVQRPSVLIDWEAGRDTDGAGRPVDGDLAWQPPLWRALVDAVGEPSPVRRHAEALTRVRGEPSAIDLPARLSLFGHTRLPVTEMALLEALAERREVHLWLPHPSPVLWTALGRSSGGPVVRAEDPSYEEVGHPLLATLGRDVRELQRGLPVGGESAVADAPIRRETLLGWLQGDIAANRRPDETTQRRLDQADRTVQVHACHGAARQVEVLREVVLGLIEDDAGAGAGRSLQPRDVLVMCPDIETYAPLIEAAFGLGTVVAGAHPGQQLQVRLADRALVQTNPLLGVAQALLDLAGGRATASTVLDLLHRDPVRRRFRFTDDDLETITGWVRQAGIRWAYDADHRAPYGLQDFVQNTWRFGLDRVLAGVAMPGEPEGATDSVAWVGPTLPLDDVGSTSIDLAGRLAEAVERLRRVTDGLVGTHPADHWLDTLRAGIDELTQTGRDEEWQTGQAHRELAGMATEAEDRAGGRSGPPDLRLPDVRALLSDRLAGRPTRASFRTGCLTVCTMVPMRSVPHRVVCLLGLDDGIYPRSATSDGDDVLARRPLTGERDARSEDRQLLLDAVMAAQDHLVVLYSGAEETTNRGRPPAVPLGELLDALDVTVPGGSDHALVRHPLQDFDPLNFRSSRLRVDGPFSFDAQALAGARSATRDRVAPPSLRDDPLPPAPPDDVDLTDLVQFFLSPVKAFLRERLEVRLAREGEELLDGLPVEVDGLAEWQVGSRLLADLVRGASVDHARQAEWRRGALPPGRLGWLECCEIAKKAQPVAEKYHSFTQGHPARSVDVDVDLGGGRRLRGTVGELYADRRVIATYSRLGPRQLLESWIPLLALSATYPQRGWTAGALGRGEKGRRGEADEAVGRATFIAQEDAATHLRELVSIRDLGLTRPIPLPLKTGFAWASHWREGVDVSARKQAGFEWTSSKFPGEDAKPEHVAVWGEGAALDVLLAPPDLDEQVPGQTTRLGAYAARVWKPLREARL